MISSLTTKGALATFEALALGAVDFVAKPDGTISLSLDAIASELVAKVRTAAASRVRPKAATPRTAWAEVAKKESERPAKPPLTGASAAATGVVVIGVSTGGPQTLEAILPRLPADLPWPVVLAQHMPAAFTQSFAERLNRMSALNVVEVARPVAIVPGTVYIARGDADLALMRRSEGIMASPRPASDRYIWHPSVDCLARSALDLYKPECIIGVLLHDRYSQGWRQDDSRVRKELRRVRHAEGADSARRSVSRIGR